MQRRTHRFSIFSQPLDAAAFAAYFLGAVVPLLALAYVAERYVLPELADRNQAMGLVALLLSMGLLSLGSYLVLRRITIVNLNQLQRHNDRLHAILEASQHLSSCAHRAEAAQILVSRARRLTRAEATYVLIAEKSSAGRQLSTLAQEGEQAPSLYDAHRGSIEEVVELAITSARPELRGGAADGPALCCAPIPGEDPAAIAVLGGREAPCPEEVDALSTLAALGAVALRSADLQDKQRNFFIQITELLLTALDQHLGNQQGHARRVARIANRLGHELGLDAPALERLHFAALLHDIGMLRIPIHRLADMTAARKHPEFGYRMLGMIRLWEDLAPFVRYHHEWFNGQGYPEGLIGEAIPLEARIIGLAEAVDAMISSTSYKPPRSLEEMLCEVQGCSGTQFDPNVVRALLDLVQRGEMNLS